MGKRVGEHVGRQAERQAGTQAGRHAVKPVGRQSVTAWIEDSDRPGGIGRSERERLFWERVASGRPTFGQPQRRRSPRSSARRKTSSTSIRTARELPTTDVRTEEIEDRWESLRLATVTMLTVIVFGLGWVTLELESVSASNGYAWLPSPAPPTGSDLRAEFDSQTGIELSGRSE